MESSDNLTSCRLKTLPGNNNTQENIGNRNLLQETVSCGARTLSTPVAIIVARLKKRGNTLYSVHNYRKRHSGSEKSRFIFCSHPSIDFFCERDCRETFHLSYRLKTIRGDDDSRHFPRWRFFFGRISIHHRSISPSSFYIYRILATFYTWRQFSPSVVLRFHSHFCVRVRHTNGHTFLSADRSFFFTYICSKIGLFDSRKLQYF